MGIEVMEDRKLLEFQAVPLKGPMHRLTQITPSEIQHWGSILTGTKGIGEELKWLGSA